MHARRRVGIPWFLLRTMARARARFQPLAGGTRRQRAPRRTDAEPQAQAGQAPVGLTTLCWLFLRIASTSFGGFMAMVSVVRNVVVERRKLLSEEDMLNGVALAAVLPGPTAINVVAYVGYRLRGIAGAVLCVFVSVLPAFLLMTLLSMAYQRWGDVPAVGKVFLGVVPAVAAIVAAAAWNMCRAALSSLAEGVLAACAAGVTLAFPGVHGTLITMAGAALAGRWWFGGLTPQGRYPESSSGHSFLGANARLFALAALPAFMTPLEGLDPGLPLKLLGVFSGLSLLMFGGGYVSVPLLQQTVVDTYGWVTQREFVDAIALGQMTPGPIMISATFIGYKVAGVAGAVAATVGMFAPAAALAVIGARLLARSKGSPGVQAALRGVRAASAGMVCASAVLIGKSAAPTWTSAALFAIALIMLTRYRIEAAWIIPAAGLIGFFTC